MANRESFKDKLARVLPLLEDKAEAWVEYCLRKPDEASRHHLKWSGKGGLYYYRNGPRAGRWWWFEESVGGDLVDFYAHHYLLNGKAHSEALKGAMEWLGLPVDGPVPDASKAAQLRRAREAKKAHDAAIAAAETAKKSDEAKAIVRAGLPVPGTPVEAYIRDHRAIPASSFVDAPLVWDAKEKAAAFIVTNDAGGVEAVQHVALTPAGAKDNRYYRGKDKRTGKERREAKNTVGPRSKGVVRFAADTSDAGEYLIIGEGPETAWSGNITMGFEAWATLGGMSHAISFAINGRTVIILRDDDGDTTGGYRAADKAVREFRDAGCEVIEAWPFEQRRSNNDDFNTLLQEGGVEAVRARIEHAIARHTHSQFELPLDRVSERLATIAAEFFERVAAFNHDGDEAPPVWATGASVGAGKSRALSSASLDYLVALRNAGINHVGVLATPEHNLSDELANDFNALATARGIGLRAGPIRGREALNPDGSGEKMCRHIDVIRKALSLAVDDIEGEVCDVCPDRSSCAYWKQRDADYDFTIVSHNALFAELPPAVRERGLDFVVIDESMVQAGLIGVDGRGAIPLDSLMPAAGMAYKNDDDGKHLVAIREDLAIVLMKEPDGYVSMDAVRRANIKDGMADYARKQEFARKLDKRHERDWQKRTANADLHRMAMLWSIIDEAMKEGLDRIGRLRLVTVEGVRWLHLYGRQDVKAGWQVPTINIDALHRPDLFAHYYPTVEDRGFLPVAAPHQRITQVVGESWGKTYLVPREGEDDTPKMRAKRRRAKAMVLHHAAAIGGDILLAGSKRVVAALKDSGLPSNIDIGHYNALAGRNKWSDFDGVVLLGTVNPKAEQVERMAAALTGKAPLSVLGSEGRFPKADAQRLVRKGRSVVSVPVQGYRHPDPLVEALRQHITLGEVVQALGRVRGVRRGADKPVKVVILSDAVMPFPVDCIEAAHTVSHRDLMVSEGGIAFEDGTSAAKAYPGLYRSPSNARDLFREERSRGEGKAAWDSLIGIPYRQPHAPFAEADTDIEGDGTAKVTASRSLIESPYRDRYAVNPKPASGGDLGDPWGSNLSTAVFQRQGNGQRPQRAWFDPALCPDPRAAIEAYVGPLAHFEVTGPAGDPVSLPMAVGSDLIGECHSNPAPVSHPVPSQNRVAVDPAVEGKFAATVPDDPADLIPGPSQPAQPEPIIIPMVDPIEDDQPDDWDGKRVGECDIPQEVWDAAKERAHDAGMSMGEVAKQWCGVSLPHLSNMKAQRRGGTWKVLAGLREFLMWADRGGAKHAQLRLF